MIRAPHDSCFSGQKDGDDHFNRSSPTDQKQFHLGLLCHFEKSVFLAALRLSGVGSVVFPLC